LIKLQAKVAKERVAGAPNAAAQDSTVPVKH